MEDSEARRALAAQARMLNALRQTQLEQSRTLADLSHAVGVLLVGQDRLDERLDELLDEVATTRRAAPGREG